MTDLAEVAAPVSTTLDTDISAGASGGGQPRALGEPEAKAPDVKPASLRETVAAAMKEATTEPDVKPEAKPDPKDVEKKPEAKAAPDRSADGKFAPKEPAKEGGEKADAAADAIAKGIAPPVTDKVEATEAKATKSNGHIEPPAKFLPDAKELWRNAPRPVQRDVENMAREHEAEISRYREAGERYEPIRQYDELARQHGRAGAHESLAEVAALEDLMQKNPLAALNQIMMRAGPRKADGQPVSLYELAQAIVNSGQDGYNRMLSQVPQHRQQQQDDPRVSQLEREISNMRQQQLATTIIEPFKAANPRYDELEEDIAFFLQSGKIPESLSPQDRLGAAYDMAVRINPASHAEPADQLDPDPGRRADNDLSGSKSIKSAPGAVSPDIAPDRGGSIRDLLADEMRRQKRSG